MLDPAPPAAERWCAGLPHAGERALSDPERAWLTRRLTRTRRRLLLAATGLGLVTALLPLAFAWRVPLGEALGLAALAWLGAAGLVGAGFALTGRSRARRLLAAAGLLFMLGQVALESAAHHLLGRSLHPAVTDLTAAVRAAILLLGLIELWARARDGRRLLAALGRARADLARGRVEVFAAHTAQTTATTAAPPEPHRLEVLPQSGLLLRAGGSLVQSWNLAPVAALAPARLHALRVPIPGARARDPNLRIHRRSLSPDERVELRAQARRLRRHVGPVVVTWLAAAGYVVARAALDGQGPTMAHLLRPGAMLWLLLAVLASAVYATRLRAARRLRQDAGFQWLVSVDEADPRSPDTVPRMEVLPVSRLLWTEDGRPAAWRMQH